MNENENIVPEEENVQAVEETALTTVQDLSGLQRRSETKSGIFTNIKDKKMLFNIDNNKVDALLNDCEGELINVKQVVIKRFEKPLKEPVVDETTGEILKDKEITMSCVLVDDQNKTYATGSKTFTIEMIRYLTMFGLTDEGFTIKITKTKQDSGFRTLGFELV